MTCKYLVKYIGKYTFAFAAPFHYRYLKEHFNELTEKQKDEFKMSGMLLSDENATTPDSKGFFKAYYEDIDGFTALKNQTEKLLHNSRSFFLVRFTCGATCSA